MSKYDDAVDRYVDHLNACGLCKGREVEAMCFSGQVFLRDVLRQESATHRANSEMGFTAASEKGATP